MPAKATSSRKTHIVRQLNPHGSCQRFVFVKEEVACHVSFPSNNLWRVFDNIRGIPDTTGTRMTWFPPIGSLSVLTLCWDGATSACRTQLKKNVSPTAMKSLRGCFSLAQAALCLEIKPPLESKNCTAWACAPWFWSLHAPVLLRAQPVQQERTCVPVFLFMVMGVKIITRETFLVMHSKGSLEFWGC